jgi:arsenite-transporting ATPase
VISISLADIFDQYPDRRYIMFGGKGGLGKTTFSAAAAYYLAKKGKKVLVFSVDPQASLTDIFERDIFGKGPTEIIPNLYAQEIDADRRVKEYQQEIRQKILNMYGMDKIPDEVESYIAAAAAEPAMEESAIFDEVVDIVVKGGYDYYIYDLVPLGHALYYLSMASVYDAWISKITGLREQMREYDQVAAVIRREKEMDEDAILNELIYIKDRINKSSSILTDKKKTAFFFVVTAEEMVIKDTLKAAELFAKFDVPLSGYIINRVLPSELKDQNIPGYLKNRLQMQEHYLKVIDTTFGKQILASVPEMERDVTGLPMIEKMARAMFGGVGYILNGKRILAVDDEPDVLTILEDEILGAAPECKFEKATTYEEAAKKLESQTYDVVLLDIMGVRGFDLLESAVKRNFRVAMLTAHALSSEALNRSFKMKAMAYLPKESLGEIVPFLEDVLKYEYLPSWKRLMGRLKRYFDSKFGSGWEKKTDLP